MKKFIILILSVLSIYIISTIIRNNNHHSIEETIFIDSIGLDYDKTNKQYHIYYHLTASQTLLTSNMGSTTSEITYSIGKVSADGIYEGFQKLYQNSIKNLTITHVQSFILTFDFVTIENLKKLCTIVKTYDYISPNFYVFATDSKLSDIYAVTNPENISPFFSIITGNDFITSYDSTYFTEVARSIYEEYLTTKLITLKAEKEIWQNNDEKITTVKPTGALYINKDNQKLYLDQSTFKAITLVNHQNTSTITTNDINFLIHKSKIKIIYKNNQFTLKVRGTIYATNTNINNREDIRIYFNNLIKNEFIKLINTSKENNIDLFNLQNKIYRNYHFKDYKKISHTFNYNNININYDINYKLL